MKPDVFRFSINLLPQDGGCLRLSRPHQPCFSMKRRDGCYGEGVELYSTGIEHDQPNISMARWMRRMDSSLPNASVMSKIPGPLPSPTSAKRAAFMMLPR